MKLKFKVTGITKTEREILVQLAGEYGTGELTLPSEHQDEIMLGDGFFLEKQNKSEVRPELVAELGGRAELPVRSRRKAPTVVAVPRQSPTALKPQPKS